MNKKTITNSFEETQKVGFDLAKTLKGGEVISLHGDLGSGKTTFTQGLAKGLGINTKIISPTFIIVRRYVIPDLIGDPENKLDSHFRGNDNKRDFYHIDLYRVENDSEIEGLGLLEIIKDKENIVVIEWVDKIEHLLPSNRVNIIFNYIDENKREIIIEQKT